MKNIKFIPLVALLMAMVIVGCKKDENTGPYYNVSKLNDVVVQKQGVAYKINVLFQVTDKDGYGIPGLTTNQFLIKEDGQRVGSEAGITITPKDQVDIKIQTALLLDNSYSVKADLPKIREAAIALVDQKTDQQYMAVYAFAGDLEVLQEMTNDKALLKAAINSLTINKGDSMTTNLYGALKVMGRLPLWNEYSSIDSIRRGNLICLTDGDESSHINTLTEAKTALKNHKVYMLGLGKEMTVSIMEQLGEFHHAEDIDQLKTEFLDIQTKIMNTANSFYWLYYTSPRRGTTQYKLWFGIDGNSNGSSTGYIEQSIDPTKAQ